MQKIKQIAILICKGDYDRKVTDKINTLTKDSEHRTKVGNASFLQDSFFESGEFDVMVAKLQGCKVASLIDFKKLQDLKVEEKEVVQNNKAATITPLQGSYIGESETPFDDALQRWMSESLQDSEVVATGDIYNKDAKLQGIEKIEVANDPNKVASSKYLQKENIARAKPFIESVKQNLQDAKDELQKTEKPIVATWKKEEAKEPLQENVTVANDTELQAPEQKEVATVVEDLQDVEVAKDSLTKLQSLKQYLTIDRESVARDNKWLTLLFISPIIIGLMYHFQDVYYKNSNTPNHYVAWLMASIELAAFNLIRIGDRLSGYVFAFATVVIGLAFLNVFSLQGYLVRVVMGLQFGFVVLRYSEIFKIQNAKNIPN